MVKRWMRRGNSLFILVFFSLITCSAPVFAQQNIYKTLLTPFYDAGGDECEAGPVTPGEGAPEGAQFPDLNPGAMANAINAWIVKQNPNSRMKGLGTTIVASSKKSNVNPFLIVAIARKESSMADPTDYNVKNGNNSFGRTATESQPHFQGARLWYKWSSVKASVDSTASENKNAVGGGDMAAYLRNQYGSQIDHDNLTALFLIYAPPGENDTVKYIAQVQGWLSELISLTTGQPDDPGTITGECEGAVAGDAVKTAINYAWPDFHPPNYFIMKPTYKQAIDAAMERGEYVGGGSHPGIDCGGFTTRVMRDSKADADYNKYEGYTVLQQRYLDEHPAKYEKLENVTGTAQLEPGDIAISDIHTYMYVGSQPGFHGNSASASFSTKNTSWRTPMADNAFGFSEFDWYRLKR